MAEENKQVTEVKAFAREIHVSPRKARLVAHLVKGLPVDQALAQLDFLVKKPAQPIKKLVNSAVANASHNFQIEPDRLFIKNLTVNQGRVFQKYAPRAQGRAFPVRKRTSHLGLVLGVSQTAFKSYKKLIPPKKPATPPVKQAAKPEQKSRFAFWRNLPRRQAGKKEQDTTQVPSKQDVKGKHYTGFDRRGKMGE